VRNEDAHSSSVASTEPAVIHDLRTMMTHMVISGINHNCSARVCSTLNFLTGIAFCSSWNEEE
jgi:hypothetical protein